MASCHPRISHGIAGLSHRYVEARGRADGEARGGENLVVSALRHEVHATHQTIDEAIAFSREVGAERTYFIHMCHTAGKQAEMDEQLPEGVRFAYDGLTIEC